MFLAFMLDINTFTKSGILSSVLGVTIGIAMQMNRKNNNKTIENMVVFTLTILFVVPAILFVLIQSVNSFEHSVKELEIEVNKTIKD